MRSTNGGVGKGKPLGLSEWSKEIRKKSGNRYSRDPPESGLRKMGIRKRRSLRRFRRFTVSYGIVLFFPYLTPTLHCNFSPLSARVHFPAQDTPRYLSVRVRGPVIKRHQKRWGWHLQASATRTPRPQDHEPLPLSSLAYNHAGGHNNTSTW